MVYCTAVVYQVPPYSTVLRCSKIYGVLGLKIHVQTIIIFRDRVVLYCTALQLFSFVPGNVLPGLYCTGTLLIGLLLLVLHGIIRVCLSIILFVLFFLSSGGWVKVKA